MIATFPIATVLSGLAIAVALLSAVLTFRAATRGARNAESNTELAQIRAVNETLREEVDRLTEKEEQCQKRLESAETEIERCRTAIARLHRRLDDRGDS